MHFVFFCLHSQIFLVEKIGDSYEGCITAVFYHLFIVKTKTRDGGMNMNKLHRDWAKKCFG